MLVCAAAAAAVFRYVTSMPPFSRHAFADFRCYDMMLRYGAIAMLHDYDADDIRR